VSFQDDEWLPGKAITEEMGTNRNAVIEQMWQWYLRRPGAALPERPPAAVIERAIQEWLEQPDSE
jgi:hypothetical protein